MHAAKQNCIKKKWFSSLKVNTRDAVGFFRLGKDGVNLGMGQCPALPRAAPYKTMIAFKSTLVGEKDVEAGKLHFFLGFGSFVEESIQPGAHLVHLEGFGP